MKDPALSPSPEEVWAVAPRSLSPLCINLFLKDKACLKLKSLWSHPDSFLRPFLWVCTEDVSSDVFFLKGTHPIRSGPHLYDLIYLHFLTLNTARLQVGASTFEFGGYNNQSICLSISNLLKQRRPLFYKNKHPLNWIHQPIFCQILNLTVRFTK